MIQHGYSFYRLAEGEGYEVSPNGKRWASVRPVDVPLSVRMDLRREARKDAS